MDYCGLACASGQPVYDDACGPVNRPLVMARCRISKCFRGGLRGLDVSRASDDGLEEGTKGLREGAAEGLSY